MPSSRIRAARAAMVAVLGAPVLMATAASASVTTPAATQAEQAPELTIKVIVTKDAYGRTTSDWSGTCATEFGRVELTATRTFTGGLSVWKFHRTLCRNNTWTLRLDLTPRNPSYNPEGEERHPLPTEASTVEGKVTEAGRTASVTVQVP
ncbi:hypothetical protein [Nonomuraea dietziae]|uniref:hypothetical protein n=1 Tax=Nonomuraea dietziae TaxID=65515 RepID=UPI003449460C